MHGCDRTPSPIARKAQRRLSPEEKQSQLFNWKAGAVSTLKDRFGMLEARVAELETLTKSHLDKAEKPTSEPGIQGTAALESEIHDMRDSFGVLSLEVERMARGETSLKDRLMDYLKGRADEIDDQVERDTHECYDRILEFDDQYQRTISGLANDIVELRGHRAPRGEVAAPGARPDAPRVPDLPLHAFPRTQAASGSLGAAVDAPGNLNETMVASLVRAMDGRFKSKTHRQRLFEFERLRKHAASSEDEAHRANSFEVLSRLAKKYDIDK